MTLAQRVPLLLLLLFLPLAGLAAFAARSSLLGLVLAEAAVLLALSVSWRFLRLRRAVPDLVRSGRELLAEGDFTTRFRHLGQRDIDDLVGLFNALSEELRRERLRLEERNLLLGKLVAASPAGVVILDLEDRVDLVNPAAAALLGSGQPGLDPLLGRRAVDLPAPFGAAAGLAAGGVQVVALAGGRRARVARAEFDDRGFGRSFLLVEEITDEIRASERSAYEKVIRLVSHEVNNSAGAIVSLLESSRTILRAARQDEPQGDCAAGIAGGKVRAAKFDAAEVDDALAVASNRMRNLAAFVDGFAAVVRLPEPVLRRFDLADLVRDLVTLHRPETRSRDLTLDFRAPGASVHVLADRDQLEQAVVNLLRNALEATPDGGRIVIALTADRRTAALSIHDSGSGIPPAVALQLFTPFFSTKRDGRGLGLTLVREIALRHGGEVGLHTHSEGGAVAELRLPLGTAPARAAR